MTRTDYPREKVVWGIVIPQIVILLISIFWIYFFPKDNVSKYFNFSPQILVEGFLTGLGLALAGYGFYFFAKK